MLSSALKGYGETGGAHLPMNTGILSKAREVQINYAIRFETSGDALNALRVAMYPRESAHIGFVIGQQQAMKERGAKRWRRVLHPELSVTGPCQFCTSDSFITHDIEEPFFEFHPNGVCGVQGVQYETPGGAIEMPLPYTETPTEFIKIVREVFDRIKQIVRRIRR